MNIESITRPKNLLKQTHFDYHFQKAMLKRLYQGIIRYRENWFLPFETTEAKVKQKLF